MFRTFFFFDSSRICKYHYEVGSEISTVINYTAPSAGAVKYTDCISAERKDQPPTSALDIALNKARKTCQIELFDISTQSEQMTYSKLSCLK